MCECKAVLGVGRLGEHQGTRQAVTGCRMCEQGSQARGLLLQRRGRICRVEEAQVCISNRSQA